MGLRLCNNTSGMKNKDYINILAIISFNKLHLWRFSLNLSQIYISTNFFLVLKMSILSSKSRIWMINWEFQIDWLDNIHGIDQWISICPSWILRNSKITTQKFEKILGKLIIIYSKYLWNNDSFFYIWYNIISFCHKILTNW